MIIHIVFFFYQTVQNRETREQTLTNLFHFVSIIDHVCIKLNKVKSFFQCILHMNEEATNVDDHYDGVAGGCH